MTKYIGIPYIDKGRDFKGCDCYGLVKLYYKHELNIEIPETQISANQPRRIMVNYLNEISKNWTEIKCEKNAVVAFAYNPEHPKFVTHFGVMINDKQVLHCLGKINSYVSNIEDISIKPFIKGFHKWQS